METRDEHRAARGTRSGRSPESVGRKTLIKKDRTGVWRNDWPFAPSRPLRGGQHTVYRNRPDHASKEADHSPAPAASGLRGGTPLGVRVCCPSLAPQVGRYGRGGG